MAIQDDWSINYSNKTISHSGGSNRYTVNALYSWLMDLFDDAGQMDDPVPMSAQTPTEYTLINGWSFGSDADLGYLYGGSIVDGTNNDVWANFYTIGTIVEEAIVYWKQGTSLVNSHPGYVQGHIDQLIKVIDNGVSTNDRKITAYIRNLGDLYDHFEVTAPLTGGRNPVPLATANDANDDESGASVSGVTISFGSVLKDIGDGLGSATYSVVIDGGGNSVVDVYRQLKYVTRRENTTAIDSPENLTEGRFYESVDPTYAQTKQAPFGTFAGGKFFGARGIWVENISDPNNRELIDSAGVSHIPPVSITVTVTGVANGDRVLVARDDGLGNINKSQYTISSVTTNSITVTATISGDVSTSGIIRVGDTQYTYTGITAPNVFTGVSPDPTGKTGGLFVPLVDAIASGTSLASGSMIYSSDFGVIVRVRKKGILPFENTGTVTSAGLTISAIRTTDGIVA